MHLSAQLPIYLSIRDVHPSKFGTHVIPLRYACAIHACLTAALDKAVESLTSCADADVPEEGEPTKRGALALKALAAKVDQLEELIKLQQVQQAQRPALLYLYGCLASPCHGGSWLWYRAFIMYCQCSNSTNACAQVNIYVTKLTPCSVS